MKKNSTETIDEKFITKYEIAEELGLFTKLKSLGWGGLTAKETGRIGGLMTARRKQAVKLQGDLKKQGVHPKKPLT